MRSLALLTGSLLLFAGCGFAAEQSGIFGVVRDVSGHFLPGIDLQVQSESTGARWRTRSGDDGSYVVEGLPPGRYKVTVRMPGLRTVSRVGVVLGSRHGLPLDFAMELLGLHEVITVVGGRDDTDPAGGDTLLVSRGTAGAALPANGRDYRMLFDLMPGVVVTPAGVSDAGQFTSNGQRPNASTFRVDGVSANTGAGGSSLPGSFPGASESGQARRRPSPRAPALANSMVNSSGICATTPGTRATGSPTASAWLTPARTIALWAPYLGGTSFATGPSSSFPSRSRT